MTPEEKYDAHVAPKLLELAKYCQENGISLVALAEWEKGETGRTEFVSSDAGIKLLMTAWAARANGNADAFILAMLRHAKEHGHNSVYLRILESLEGRGRP